MKVAGSPKTPPAHGAEEKDNVIANNCVQATPDCAFLFVIGDLAAGAVCSMICRATRR